MKVGILTLGCDKNTVDSERYLAELVGAGAELAADLSEAEVIVVNTCGFIDAAKQESIDAIVQAGRLKESGACRALVAVGCMVERHRDELAGALPEVDLFLGASESDRLLVELEARGLIDDAAPHPGERLHVGELPHVRYLKVSEGCDHGCAFCAIPLMRGRHRSFAADEIVREAQLLELQGAREVNLVAQDLAHFGRDRRDGMDLPALLDRLVGETAIPWIRLLYLYSAGITPRLLEVMGRHERILRYLDMPIQHASDEMLRRMRRPERRESLRARLRGVREALPDVAIRTTCIVGFPGETDDDFERLLGFLDEARFDRVGVFAYSAQAGTRAAAMADDVPSEVKRERLERLAERQRAITAEVYEERIGRPAAAIVDRRAAGTEGPQGRMWWQADDIDGVAWLDREIAPGSIATVVPRAVLDDYDVRADVEHIRSDPPPPAVIRRASLPVLSVPTVGSYGR